MREEIMQVGGTPLRVATRPGTGDRASAAAVQRHRHVAGSLPAVRECTRPGHRGDPLRRPRRRRARAAQSAVPFHHPGPAAGETLHNLGHQQADAPGHLGGGLGSAVRRRSTRACAWRAGPEWRPRTGPARRRCRPTPLPPPTSSCARDWRPVGRQAPRPTGRRWSAPAQGADRARSAWASVLPDRRRRWAPPALPLLPLTAAHPAPRGDDDLIVPGGQRPHPRRGHPAHDAARLPRRPRRAGRSRRAWLAP